jgi:hypothetical protein
LGSHLTVLYSHNRVTGEPLFAGNAGDQAMTHLVRRAATAAEALRPDYFERRRRLLPGLAQLVGRQRPRIDAGRLAVSVHGADPGEPLQIDREHAVIAVRELLAHITRHARCLPALALSDGHQPASAAQPSAARCLASNWRGPATARRQAMRRVLSGREFSPTASQVRVRDSYVARAHPREGAGRTCSLRRQSLQVLP